MRCVGSCRAVARVAGAAWRAAAVPDSGRCSGQMVVELAVVVPAAIVVALVVYNLMGFVVACAAFDQAALDAIVSHGVSPAGEQTRVAAVEEVRSHLADALDGQGDCEVEVRAESVSGDDTSASFVVSPLLTRYVCTLVYRPWPRYLRLPGITLEAPLALRHERELVVDRFRSGVVV